MFALLFFLLFSTPSLAQGPEALCANPQSAADSLFVWQRPDNYDRAKAKACLDVPEGANGERIAVQLRQVLDARGLFVPVAQMSVDPAYTEDGAHKHVPLPNELPVLVLVRGADGLWRYSRDTINAVPSLYRKTFSPVSVWFQNQLPAVFYTRVLGFYLWQLLYAGVLLFVAWSLGTVVRLLLRGQVRRAVHNIGLKLDDAAYQKTNLPIVLMVIFVIVALGILGDPPADAEAPSVVPPVDAEAPTALAIPEVRRPWRRPAPKARTKTDHQTLAFKMVATRRKYKSLSVAMFGGLRAWRKLLGHPSGESHARQGGPQFAGRVQASWAPWQAR